MKKLSIIVAVTALIAFCLGYFARGAVDRTPSISKDPENSAVREHSEGPATQAQTMVRSDPNDGNTQNTIIFDHKAVITTTRSTPRASYVKHKRDRLEDFFLINGIGADRAEQIVQDLVDGDHYLSQKGNAMIDRQTVEKAELIAQGGVVHMSGTLEERAELRSEREALNRQIFGEYYEAYEKYRRSYPQRRRIKAFSSSLQEPLEYAAKETVIQILSEEQSNLGSELIREGALSAPQGWDADKENYSKHLVAMQSFNARVMDRTKPYLSASQFEQFKKHLDYDVREFELLIELADIEEAR